MKKQTFIAIGSNLDPKTNIPKILDLLLSIGRTLHISRILETEPVGDHFSFPFFNLCVSLQHNLSDEQLKEKLNQIETSLGRNRLHPNSKTKNRTADLDILFSTELNPKSISPKNIPKENYQRPMLLELLSFLGCPCPGFSELPKGQQIFWHNIPIGTEAISVGGK